MVLPRTSKWFTAMASSLTIAFWTAPGDGYDRMGFIDDFMVKTACPYAAVGMSNGNRCTCDPKTPRNYDGITIDFRFNVGGMEERWQYTHVYPAVKKDDRVRAGQLVGYYALIGLSDGPHLHISRWTPNGREWKFTDPEEVLP